MGARLAVNSHSSVFAEYLRNLEPFRTTGSLCASHYDRVAGAGLLPQEDFQLLRDSANHSASGVYIVWSYATPIAWCDNGQWVVPDVKYSPTTSQHQYTIKAALAEL